MAIAGILDRIISRKRQAALTSGQRYHQLLKDVASGSEIDADEGADVIESANKTEADFEKDVAIMQKRLTLVAQLKARNQLQATIPSLEKAQADAQAKLNAAVEQLQPIAMDAERKVRDAQNQVLQFHTVESELLRSCLDPSLLAREAELAEKRLALVRSRSPLDEDLKRARAQLRGCEYTIENLQAAIAKNKTNTPVVASDRKDLQQVRAQAESLEETVSDLASAVDAINSELAPVESELAAVRKAKLLP